jgi:hypothetical protein
MMTNISSSRRTPGPPCLGARQNYFLRPYPLAGWLVLAWSEIDPLKPEYQSSTSAEQFEVPLEKGKLYLMNPGSVAQPRDGDWRAAFAIYDECRSSLTWYRVPTKYAQRSGESGGRNSKKSSRPVYGTATRDPVTNLFRLWRRSADFFVSLQVCALFQLTLTRTNYRLYPVGYAG